MALPIREYGIGADVIYYIAIFVFAFVGTAIGMICSAFVHLRTDFISDFSFDFWTWVACSLGYFFVMWMKNI